MSNTRVAYRYAEAILDSVPEGMSTESVMQELQDVRRSIEKSRELHLFFMSPIIAQTQKAAGVDALFGDRVSPFVLSVLQLLIEKQREDLILDVILAVYDLRREREGILSTTIRSAVELTDDQRRALQDALSAASGKRVDAVYDIDPLLIGGVTVRLGDTVYDGSVRQQLKRLRDRFVRGR